MKGIIVEIIAFLTRNMCFRRPDVQLTRDDEECNTCSPTVAVLLRGPSTKTSSRLCFSFKLNSYNDHHFMYKRQKLLVYR